MSDSTNGEASAARRTPVAHNCTDLSSTDSSSSKFNLQAMAFSPHKVAHGMTVFSALRSLLRRKK